jgi:hypothetical protein
MRVRKEIPLVQRACVTSPGLHSIANTESNQKQAESMFKIDFFEFYTFLERYITTCLTIVGVYVSANAPRTNINALRFITNPEWAKTRPEASHAFHANLLEAIDQETCPLHVSFGNPEVRPQLGLAKDYRNAWKDADGGTSGEYVRENEKKNTRLEDLELGIMLRLLCAGCEHAHGVVMGQADPQTDSFTSRDFEPRTYMDEAMDLETPFEYMDDAMDLD